MSVLVVDDSVFLLKSACEFLKKIGFSKFIAVDSGEKALQAIRDHHKEIQFVWLDWNMPHPNGQEVLKQIKENDEWKHLPVFFVTTESNKAHIIAAIKMGATDYITKPIKPSTLYPKLKRFLEHH
jgi:DNA-binding response OmpR family regulator